MPRINFIPPPIDFNDRGTALVNPIMSNAMQLAETFTTEIPRIRMQQEAIAEEKRRYEGEQKLRMEDRDIAARERRLRPFALQAEKGLLSPEEIDAAKAIDPDMGGALGDISEKAVTTEQDIDFDRQFSGVLPKVQGDSVVQRGAKVARAAADFDKSWKDAMAMAEKEADLGDDAYETVEVVDPATNSTVTSKRLSEAGRSKLQQRASSLLNKAAGPDKQLNTHDDDLVARAGLARMLRMGDESGMFDIAGGREVLEAAAAPPDLLRMAEGGVPAADATAMRYNEMELTQLERMIGHSAAVRKLGQPAIDRIKALIGAGVPPEAAKQIAQQESAEPPPAAGDTPTDFSLGYEEGGPRLGRMQEDVPVPVAAPVAPATAPVAPATAPVAPATAPVGPATAPVGPALTRLAGSLTSLGLRDAALSESQSGRMAPGPGDRMLMASGGDSLVALRGVEKDIGALAQTDPETAQILRDVVEQYRQAILAANEDPAAELPWGSGAVGLVGASVEMARRQRALLEARTRLARALAELGL